MKKNTKIWLFMLLVIFANTNIVRADSVCENPGVLKVIYFILLLIDVIRIIVPIGLIVMGSIDFGKATINGEEGNQSKSLKLFVNRIISAVLIFAVPWIVKVFIVFLGDLAGGVNFTDCIENANSDTIASYQTEYDNNLKEENEKKVSESKKREEERESKRNSTTSNSGSKNVVDSSGFNSSVIENLASFSGSEVGYYQDSFWTALLFESAVFMNNYGFQTNQSKVDINTPITTDSMCKVFSVKFGEYFLYHTKYCDYTFARLSNDRGGVTDHQRDLMTKAATAVLTREFTIPKNVLYAKGSDNNQNDIGVLYDGAKDGTKQKFSTNSEDGFASTDVYGNTVSTDPNWYTKRAKELYNKYFS